MSLPKTRRWKLTHRLRNHVWGVFINGRLNVFMDHSRFIFNKFYGDKK